ncbi:hypothetical protein LSAT2_028119 [Lamellibrachia satsuma]|nr:hypothetical protein LSAT2_028119 [Lamellibrachia satsuma]
MAACNYPVNRTSIQMEGYIYQQATMREDYISMTARVIIHIREMVDWRYQLEDVHGLFCPNYDNSDSK